MKTIKSVLQVAFTYIGTVVGAGFASGQEILKFFTQFGWIATLTIMLASVLFIWLGTKLMLYARNFGAQSYEELNQHLFGRRFGTYFSMFTLVILFGISTVMLAGAGSVFAEHFNLSYPSGLLITLLLTYIVLHNGLQAIIAVNSIVVPTMMLCCCLTVLSAAGTPTSGNWLARPSDQMAEAWLAPFLYTSFNLATAQAVLVPLASSVKNRSVIVAGGLAGGVGIGLMLMGGHFALSAYMPGIEQFEIPMSKLMAPYGQWLQLLFIVVIFGEIFTTFIADVYGVVLQLSRKTGWPEQVWLVVILTSNYMISQIGFSKLLSVLYPLFGLISMIWFVLMVWKRPVA